jgi:hypothetical protein
MQVFVAISITEDELVVILIYLAVIGFWEYLRSAWHCQT